MAERQQVQTENLTQLLLELLDVGAVAHPLPLSEQDAPRPVPQEVLYQYAGKEYQVLFSGHGVYHHHLPLGPADRSRRGPPQLAPWLITSPTSA